MKKQGVFIIFFNYNFDKKIILYKIYSKKNYIILIHLFRLWLYNIARGIDNEPVTVRLVSKSIGACKKFPGKQAITSLNMVV